MISLDRLNTTISSKGVIYQWGERPLSTKRERRYEDLPPKLDKTRRFTEPRCVFYQNPNKHPDARIVTFKSSTERPHLSTSYDSSLDKSYLAQCYQHVKKVGQGSFGEVVHVVCNEDGVSYAVKSLMFKGSEVDRRKKFDEVRIFELLPPHRNIILFYRAWKQNNCLFIQTELCSCSLDALALKSRVPESTCWSFLIDMLLALKYLHSYGFVHVDIKLDNILLSMDETHCKLADFGLFRDETDKTLEKGEGDCRYLAPDFHLFGRIRAADIFCLGISFLELVTDLDLPKNGTNWELLRSGRPYTDYIDDYILEGVSEVYLDLVQSMMRTKAEFRPTAVDLLSCHEIQTRMNHDQFKIYKQVPKPLLCDRAQHSPFISPQPLDLSPTGFKPARRSFPLSKQRRLELNDCNKNIEDSSSVFAKPLNFSPSEDGDSSDTFDESSPKSRFHRASSKKQSKFAALVAEKPKFIQKNRKVHPDGDHESLASTDSNDSFAGDWDSSVSANTRLARKRRMVLMES